MFLIFFSLHYSDLDNSSSFQTSVNVIVLIALTDLESSFQYQHMFLFQNLQVPVVSWFDDMSDTELLDLIPFFERLSKVDDIYAFLTRQRTSS